MPVCNNCQHKWSWKGTFKRSFTLGVGMMCPNCNEMQYYSARFRKRSSMVPFLIPLLLTVNLFLGPSYLILILLLAFLPVYLILFPFFVELSNDEEALF